MRSNGKTLWPLVVSIGVVLLLSSPAVYSQCYTLPPGMLHWWPGDGDAHDLVSANHGSLVGDTTFLPGKVGQAFAMDGAGDFVDVSMTTRVLPAWSMEFWFLINNFTSPYYMGAFQLQDQFNIFTANGSGGFGIYGLFAVDPRFTYPLQPHTWYHYAVTYDGTTIRQYINGAVAKTSIAPATLYGPYSHFFQRSVQRLE